jgi:hypothetical protein
VVKNRKEVTEKFQENYRDTDFTALDTTPVEVLIFSEAERTL